MEALTASVQGLSFGSQRSRVNDDDDIASLFNDVFVVVDSYNRGLAELDFENITVMPGDYSSAMSLYGHVVRMLRDLEYTTIMIELMPYIDEYIEYYSTISSLE